jgi:Protein of unknown function (DUF2845)
MNAHLSIALALSMNLWTPGVAHGESMRCGATIVDETTSVADLLVKCGEPQSKDVKTEDVFARNPDTGLNRKIGTKIIERWVYRRSSQTLPMAVTIVDGKVTRLERADS